MQDPLKTNKPFQTAYTTAIQEHNKYLTPQNIDDLILKLNKMETDRSQRSTNQKHHCNSLPQTHPVPVLIPTADTNNNVLFSDRYMQSLPVNSEQEMKRMDENQWWSSQQQSNHSSNSNNNNNSNGRRCYRLAPIDKTKLIGLSPTRLQNSLGSITRPLSLTINPVKKSTSLTVNQETAHKLLNTNERMRLTNQKPELSIGQEHFPAVVGDNHKPVANVNLFICKPKRMPADLHTDNGSDQEDTSDEERDSGWNDSDQWLGLEEEDMLSDIDDDTATVLTNTSGMGELESDWGSDLGHEDIVMSQSMPPDVVTGCGPVVEFDSVTGCGPVRSIGVVSTLVIPPRTTSVGERGGVQATPPLTPSLFPGRPATIHFPLESEKYESLKPEQRALLKWKMSSIIPNVVKHVIARVGFKPTNTSKWIGYWGNHIKSEAFRSIKPNQKVNHFPGSFNLGRKDRLWRNLFRMQAHYGKREFDFIPETYILPNDMRNFKRVWESNNTRKISKWIIKPPASARGIGIKVINKWAQIPKKRSVIVQKYISNPFLINGSKFDLRVYVYVTSFDPLIIYIFRDGLVRFATVKYSKSTKKLSNRYMHLTNYSVNKHSSEFVSNSDETQCFGHKWGLLALWGYMNNNLSIDPGPVWERIKDVVIKTIISCDSHITSLIKANVRHGSCVHELFGFDIMLDKHLKPWLLEVNVSPSLHSNSSLDLNIKGIMMRDLFNMCRFRLPVQNKSSSYVGLSSDERTKHSKFSHCKLHSQQIDVARILDNLSEDDCNILMDLEDEFSRRGGFIRVFPQLNSYSQYAKYFHIQRYYNILIDQWLTKYSVSPYLGIIELKKQLIKRSMQTHT